MGVFTRAAAWTTSAKVTAQTGLRSLATVQANGASNQNPNPPVFPGLVGEILLNNIPLRDFTIHSLEMKPSFIDRFVSAGPRCLSLML